MADILTIVNLENGKLSAQSELVLRRKLFVLRNQILLESDAENDDVSKLAI